MRKQFSLRDDKYFEIKIKSSVKSFLLCRMSDTFQFSLGESPVV